MKVAAALAALVLAGAATNVHAASKGPRAGPKDAVRRCVVLTEARGDDERSLRFSLRNACAQRLECTMRWDVTCGRDATEESRESVVEANESHAFVASAASCSAESWKISPPRWRCTTARRD